MKNTLEDKAREKWEAKKKVGKKVLNVSVAALTDE